MWASLKQIHGRQIDHSGTELGGGATPLNTKLKMAVRMKSISPHKPAVSTPPPHQRSTPPAVTLSKEAAEFACHHHASNTLAQLQSLILDNHSLADSISVELVPDPEIADYSLITFKVTTHATVDEVSDFN